MQTPRQAGNTPGCHRLLLILLMAGWAFGVAGDTGGGDEPESSGENAGAGVPVIHVAPTMRFPAVLPPAEGAAGRPAPPEPLSQERRADLIAATFAGNFVGTSAGTITGMARDTVTLSPRRPFDASLGHLVLDGARRFDPLHGVAFDAGDGTAGVSLLVEAGKAYLVDFSVNGWAAGNYSIEADGQSLDVPDDGSLGHVIVGLKAAAAGWVNVRLGRPGGGGFFLHAVDVTPVDPPAPEEDQSGS